MNNKVFTCLGASNHVEEDRADYDFYATSPKAGEMLLELIPQLNSIYEPCVGLGHLAEVFRKANKLARVSDLVDRNYYPQGIETEYNKDILLCTESNLNNDIITNPPYTKSMEFCEKCINMIADGRYVCMFLKLQFLEGKARKEFFKKYPPKYLFVSSSRIVCAKNGDFDNYNSCAIAYGWYVWQKGFKGDTIIKWFN